MDSKNIEISDIQANPRKAAKPTPRPAQAEAETKPFTTNTYEIDGQKVDVYSKEFHPSQTENSKQDEAVLFIPGWSSGTGKNFEILGQAFADEGGKNSYVINSIAGHGLEAHRFATEARGLMEFIREKGLKKITIVGNSEGGAKALYLVDILQEQFPDTAIDGLVLLAPIGLYDQEPEALAARFAKESMRFYLKTDIKNAPKAFRQEYEERFRNYDPQGFLPQEIEEMGSGIKLFDTLNFYLGKLPAQLVDMSEEASVMQKIKCPVVLIQGRSDSVSKPEKVVGKEGLSNYQQRVRTLKEKFFPNSPDVSMILPKRVGSHGIIHFRQEEIAKTSMYLLERTRRKNQPPGEKNPSPISTDSLEAVTLNPTANDDKMLEIAS